MVRITIWIMTGASARTTINTQDGAVHPRLLACSHELQRIAARGLALGRAHLGPVRESIRGRWHKGVRGAYLTERGKGGRAHHSCRRDERAGLRVRARWNGADNVDDLMRMTTGISSNAAMGKGVTEVQYTTK